MFILKGGTFCDGSLGMATQGRFGAIVRGIQQADELIWNLSLSTRYAPCVALHLCHYYGE